MLQCANASNMHAWAYKNDNARHKTFEWRCICHSSQHKIRSIFKTTNQPNFDPFPGKSIQCCINWAFQFSAIAMNLFGQKRESKPSSTLALDQVWSNHNQIYVSLEKNATETSTPFIGKGMEKKYCSRNSQSRERYIEHWKRASKGFSRVQEICPIGKSLYIIKL